MQLGPSLPRRARLGPTGSPGCHGGERGSSWVEEEDKGRMHILKKKSVMFFRVNGDGINDDGK